MNAVTTRSGAASPALPAPANRQVSSGNMSLSNSQKAALVIAALGPEAAGPIIERIDDKHLRAFARAYAHFQTIPKSMLQSVVEEFVLCLSKDDDEMRGGFDETRELLSQFIGSDDIIRLMEDIDVPNGESVWEKIERTPDQLLADYLSKQNTQLIAVVLSRINTEQASRLIELLETDIAEKVIIRLSRPMKVSREVLMIMADRIEQEFLAPMRTSSKARNPGEMIGHMMNNVTSEKREKLLSFMTSEIPEIVTDVRKSMLTFQDLATRVPPQAITMVIKEMELDQFLLAAKFGKQNAPSCVEFMFKNISQRMAQQYEEQMDKMPTPDVKEAEAAQAVFMSHVRKLAAAGEITLIEIKEDEDDAEGGEEAA